MVVQILTTINFFQQIKKKSEYITCLVCGSYLNIHFSCSYIQHNRKYNSS